MLGADIGGSAVKILPYTHMYIHRYQTSKPQHLRVAGLRFESRNTENYVEIGRGEGGGGGGGGAQGVLKRPTLPPGIILWFLTDAQR